MQIELDGELTVETPPAPEEHQRRLAAIELGAEHLRAEGKPAERIARWAQIAAACSARKHDVQRLGVEIHRAEGKLEADRRTRERLIGEIAAVVPELVELEQELGLEDAGT